jgi:hypothetical protein
MVESYQPAFAKFQHQPACAASSALSIIVMAAMTPVTALVCISKLIYHTYL